MRPLLALRIGFAFAALGLADRPSLSAERLKIGVGAPITGVDSVFGSQVRLGVEQAIADINADGGFLGQRAQAIVGDDGGDPKKGVEVAKRFVTSDIKIVVGHFSSAVTVPASTVYGEANVLDITPSAEAPQLTDRGLTTIFRTCGREDQQAPTVARFVTDHRYTKISILYDRTAAGKKTADGVRAALAERGIKAVLYNSLPDGSREVSALVSRLKTLGTQIVFWGGGPQGGALLARQLHDVRISLIGGLAMASDDFANVAGSAADGTYIVFPRDPRRQKAAAALLDRFKDKNIDPDGYTFYAYAAVQIIHQAAEAAQSLKPERLAAAMHANRHFQTVLGPITFNANGDPNVSDLTVYVWRKGPSGRMEFLDPANS